MSSSSLHMLVITLTLTHKTHVQMHTHTTQARKEGRKKHRSPNRAQALQSQGMHIGAHGQVRFQRVSNKVLKTHNENQAQHSVPPLKFCKTFNQEIHRIQRL